MATLNRAQIIGNLGADPEVHYMPDGGKVTTISVATSETWKDDKGNKKKNKEWHRVIFFRGLADIAENYLKEGKQVYIEGKLRTRKWTDDNNVVRYSTEIIGRDMKMLGKKPVDSGEWADDDKDTGFDDGMCG
ncbi:single-stranded DNA-binding protein [Nitrosovibrio sp. Nv6]|uniref:single-stranded DNA-binding protein n=1 Tax=Nitrosovibrio sp. Nv6 TaxID=1855340 RepID=UPI0008B854CE|nr:single-stranded DNA-binding protein [Nitrosovibrio sp. Nv6]SEP42732.1 single-strand DNA-binding protein [Nitrosovibrio sp. Nv6]